MSLTFYRTQDGMPPLGGKPPAPKSIPNPNRRFVTPTGAPPFGGLPPSQRPSPPESPPSYTIATTYPVYCTYPAYHLPTPPASPPEPEPEPAPAYRFLASAPSPPSERALPQYAQLPSPPPQYQCLQLASASPPAPAPAFKARFEPPGTNFNGHTPDFGPKANFSYVFPSAHISLQFWDDGTQPWLAGGSSLVSHRVVPACMRIKDLIKQLGAPGSEETADGITVTKLRVRRPDGQENEFGDIEEGIRELMWSGGMWKWVKGKTYTLGSAKDKTLEELKWKGVVGVAVSV